MYPWQPVSPTTIRCWSPDPCSKKRKCRSSQSGQPTPRCPRSSATEFSSHPLGITPKPRPRLNLPYRNLVIQSRSFSITPPPIPEPYPDIFKHGLKRWVEKVLLNLGYPGGCSISSLGEHIMNLPSRPLFVYLAGLPDCIGEVVASLRSAGVTQPIIGGDGLDTSNLLSAGNSLTDNVWYTTHAWLSSETGTPLVKEFVTSYQAAFGNPPQNAFAALGYDAANLLLDVLRRAETFRPRDILEAFEATENFLGVTGTISYDKQSHVPQKTVWTIKVTDGVLSLADARIPDSVPPPIISSE